MGGGPGSGLSRQGVWRPDAGYESEEDYSWFEEAEKDCYIKPQNYERSKGIAAQLLTKLTA